MVRKSIIAAILVPVLVGSLAQTASAQIRVLDRGSAEGDQALATASGRVSNPKRIWLKVRSQPDQRIDASWSMTCSRGSRLGTKDGSFSGRTPIKRRLAMPFRRPDSCSIATRAELRDTGLIVVILLARV
jgi:hypothetical protein